MATKVDYQVASMAAGFTIGFGFLTVWEAIKQTRANKSPLRSAYIYMIWGEIVSNLAIMVIVWLMLDGKLMPDVPILFLILFFWVFEIQLLMQIIINRISIIAESRKTMRLLKWGTAVVMTLINIAVFCIFIPAHTIPPVSQTFVNINKYWDRVSKGLILLIDAGLNWYFLRIVKLRLLRQHGLVKYQPLVTFNAWLMALSVGMDALLIGLMSYPNQLVFTQFHPVAYMVKLNIEMTMASLIARLARIRTTDYVSNSYSQDPHGTHHTMGSANRNDHRGPESLRGASIELRPSSEELDKTRGRTINIHRKYDVEVQFEGPKSTPSSEGVVSEVGDEVSLTKGYDCRSLPGIPGTAWDATVVAGNPRAGGRRVSGE